MITKSQVKYIQSLGQKKVRDEEGVFVAEGSKIINEFLQTAHLDIVSILATAEWLKDHQSQLGFMGTTDVLTLKQDEMDRISFLSTASQVLAVIKKPVWQNPVDAKGQLTLVLDGIQDPGNLGTIIRTADWFGIRQIVCNAETADAFSPKVVQSTMGSIARVRCHYADLNEWISDNSEVELFVTVLGGKPLSSFQKIIEGIIVVGNESKGVSESLIKKASGKITIPRHGHAESLNAAVATGIVLSHLI